MTNKSYLIFDTETTGLPKNRKAPITYPDNMKLYVFASGNRTPLMNVDRHDVKVVIINRDWYVDGRVHNIELQS